MLKHDVPPFVIWEVFTIINVSREPIRRGLVLAIIEGCIFSVWNAAVSGNFLTGMALYLGAGGVALGVLGALPSLANLVQLASAPFVTGLVHRRNLMALFSGVQRVGAGLVGLVALLLAPAPVALMLFVVVLALGWVIMAPAVVIWQGYMADLVPIETRGRYFARRNAWGSVVGMAAVLTFGWILDHFHGGPGFRILYVVVLLAGALDYLIFLVHPELPQGDERSGLSFWESVKTPLAKAGPHRTAAFFFGAWAFAQGMAVPFFSVALVEKLGLSFSSVSVLATVASITAIVTMGFWGRWQDRVGQPKVIPILAAILASVPLLFVAAPSLGWPVLVAAHILNGTASAGMGLANQTLMMRVVPTANRGSYFAFFSTVGGIAGFVAPILAGPFTTHHLNLLFLLSAVASTGLALFWWLRLGPKVAGEIAGKP